MCGGFIGQTLQGLGLAAKPPSAEELAAQERAAAQKAQDEANKIKADQEAQKAAADAKNVAEKAAQANSDLARRQAARTLLQGASTADLSEEDPNSPSSLKRKRATLLARVAS